MTNGRHPDASCRTVSHDMPAHGGRSGLVGQGQEGGLPSWPKDAIAPPEDRPSLNDDGIDVRRSSVVQWLPSIVTPALPLLTPAAGRRAPPRESLL